MQQAPDRTIGQGRKGIHMIVGCEELVRLCEVHCRQLEFNNGTLLRACNEGPAACPDNIMAKPAHER